MWGLAPWTAVAARQNERRLAISGRPGPHHSWLRFSPQRVRKMTTDGHRYHRHNMVPPQVRTGGLRLPPLPTHHTGGKKQKKTAARGRLTRESVSHSAEGGRGDFGESTSRVQE